MRCIVFHTYCDCENKYRSLQSIGYDVHLIQYDSYPLDRHPEVIEQARAIKPDFMVYIGAFEKTHGAPVLRFDTLKHLRDVAPFIHMCDDAADSPWWETLNIYGHRECFDVQVNIDGVYNTPIQNYPSGMTLLTPIDYRPFSASKSWNERPIKMGLVGGRGYGPRGDIISRLETHGQLDFRMGPDGRTYEQYAEVVGDTRITLNHPMTGSTRYRHVKGRVVEAGFAGSALLELVDSPTNLWFTPGIDYYEYSSWEHVLHILNTVPEEVFIDQAKNLHKKVVEQHHPKVFWDKVLQKAGVSDGGRSPS